MKYNHKTPTILLASAVVLLMSCHQAYPDLEYTGETNPGITNREAYDETPIMVFVNEQDFFSVTATRAAGYNPNDVPPGRGSGEFSPSNRMKFANSKFYIFAFRDGTSRDAQGPLSAPVDLRYTLGTGSWNDFDNANCLVDDDKNYWKGVTAVLNSDDGGQLKMVDILTSQNASGVTVTDTVPKELYYSSRYQDVGYNFFAYFIDKEEERASGQFHREQDSIWYDFEIDGTQDIMCGAAPKLTPQVFLDKCGDRNISREDRDRILNIGGGYSTFAAHRDVHPEVKMTHALTQLRFTAYPGDANCNDITITGISIQSPYKGRLVVAASDRDKVGFHFTDDSKYLFLREKSPDGIQDCPKLRQDYYRLEWDESQEELPWLERNSMEVGGSLLVAPAEEYVMDIHYTQMKYDMSLGEKRPFQLTSTYKVKLDHDVTSDSYDPLTGKNIFKPGYIYNIKVAVFGISEIQVKVNVAGWENGEDVPLDPDNADIVL